MERTGAPRLCLVRSQTPRITGARSASRSFPAASAAPDTIRGAHVSRGHPGVRSRAAPRAARAHGGHTGRGPLSRGAQQREPGGPEHAAPWAPRSENGKEMGPPWPRTEHGAAHRDARSLSLWGGCLAPLCSPTPPANAAEAGAGRAPRPSPVPASVFSAPF